MPKGQIGYCANGKHLNVSHLIKLNASNIATSSHMKPLIHVLPEMGTQKTYLLKNLHQLRTQQANAFLRLL